MTGVARVRDRGLAQARGTGPVRARRGGCDSGHGVVPERQRGAGAPGRDRGISTIEVVILAPIMLMFILVLVAFGQLVDGRGAVDGAARDAARAGSLQRDLGSAMREATTAAQDDLDGTCVPGTLTVHRGPGSFAPGGLFTVVVSCQIRGLGSLGLDIRKTITSQAASPLDPFRRAAT